MIIREQSFFASLFSKSWVSVLLTILVTVLMFGFLIFIHELGHYLTARLCKVSIREFSIGMGPKIYGRVSKKTGILYSLRALPIGGYVAMEGEVKSRSSWEIKPLESSALSASSSWVKPYIMRSSLIFWPSCMESASFAWFRGSKYKFYKLFV